MPEEKKEEKKEEGKEPEIDKNKKYSWEDIHDLREENKQERKRREAAEKLAKEHEAKLKEYNDKQEAEKQKQLAEQGKFKEIAEAKDKQIAELTEKHRKQAVNSALKLKAVELGLTDQDGLAMISQDEISKLTIDENGNVHGVDELMTGFKEKKPYLFEEKKTPGVNQARPGGNNSSKPTYKMSQLKDNSFYTANKADIDLAVKEGRVFND